MVARGPAGRGRPRDSRRQSRPQGTRGQFRLQGSRGQLLLAGAFVLAVGLISLTFVLNASVHTNTLAESETGAVRGGDAVTAREAARGDVGALLGTVNREHDSDYVQAFRDGLPALARGIRDHRAKRGRLVNATLPSSPFTNGTLVKQTAENGSSDYFAKRNTSTGSLIGNRTIMEGTRVRNATFVITNSSGSDSPFVIGFDPATSSRDAWELHVYNGSRGWTLEVFNGGSRVGGPCRPPEARDSVELNIAPATFGSDYCHALSQLNPGSPYNVTFGNGNESKGRFWMVAKDDITGFPSCPSPGNICQDDALYGVDVAFEYRSSTVDYETTLVVTPGEI